MTLNLPIDFKVRRTREIKIGLANYFIEHATICRDIDCVCRASTFMDNMAELIKFDDEWERIIREVLDRK